MKRAIAILASDEFYPNFKVLYNSIREYHNMTDISIFLLYFGDKVKQHPFDVHVLLPYQIKENTLELKAKYPIADYIAAHRPNFIQWIMLQGFQKVLLLGADCVVYHSLDKIYDEYLNKDQIMMTPHILNPIAIDGKAPTMFQMPLTGHINSDVIGFKKTNEVMTILQHLNHIFNDYCKRDLSGGLFSDQGWFNFLPYWLNDVKICRDPGVNAAYYNLHERHPYIGEPGLPNYVRYGTKELDLYIYQFSGFDINQPEKLSKYQNRYNETNIDKKVIDFYKAYAEKLKKEQI